MNTHHIFKFGALALIMAFSATTTSAFQPSQQPAETASVPGNVLLALSVEFPTGLQVSYTTTTYTNASKYEGYFDNRKCYTYDDAAEVFNPSSAITGNGTCGGNEWSGNLMNWLTMTNIDQFRSVMTGGTRDDFTGKALSNTNYHGDTTERTILIRSFSDRNSYNPVKQLPSDALAPIPANYKGKWVRSGGYGSKFIVSNLANDFPNISLEVAKQSCSEHSNINRLGCFNIRVSACVLSPAQGFTDNVREANCQDKYSGAAKPEGIVQQYAPTLRYGAFGYLNDNSALRNGGVLRSAMKSVGPNAVSKTGVVRNPNVEWDQRTGIFAKNPDTLDANNTAVGNSGLINYLNKFGYEAGYKYYDPVSELYYAALRYMRGYALPSEYTNNLNSALKDGFPVITGSDLLRGNTRDPIIQSCQKNFILGIGDIRTHCDGNLPGSNNALNPTCGTETTTDPDGLNVQSLWTTVTGYEGNTSWTGGAGGRSNGTPYVAGLAHWANTTDTRSDLPGKQTISTYFVDVMQDGGSPTTKTQYWLAAKYGGFDTTLAPGNNPNEKISPTSPLAWDKDANGVPDNWFSGASPTTLKASLRDAFSKINTEVGAASSSSAAISSSRQTSDSQIIYAGYLPKDWSGTISACKPSQTLEECTKSPVWEASRWFKTTTPLAVAAPLTDVTRKIFTSEKTVTFNKSPFIWNSLSAAQKAVLNASDNLGQDRLDYLRGKRSDEGTKFRTRGAYLLGDIVNSGVTYLGGSGPAYSGANFPGHAAYRATNKNRPPVVYVGANDGMLHAFSGADGKELFGYIPGSVFANLPQLTERAFKHSYFVDSTPMVGDFEKTTSTPKEPVWGTLLVGGLGAGGKGYYALDITDQSKFATTSEANLAANLPLWEFTAAQDADLGYTFNEPSVHPLSGAYQQIAKVADATEKTGVWRVLVGNGYGSTNGKAALFMLNANTGAASTKLVAYTPSTSSSAPNGLSTPTPVDTDRDGLIDTIYAGDLLGNLHKFQFSKRSNSNYELAKPAEEGGAWRYIGKVFASGEPITTAPSVVRACDGDGWNVMFGSGKLNEETDLVDQSDRGFYSVIDKSPSSSLTVSGNQLATISPLTETTLDNGKVIRTWNPPALGGKLGWRMPFDNGERVLTNSTMPPDTGAVLFATTKPSGDVCTPGDSGFIMAVSLCDASIGKLLVNGLEVGGLSIESSGVVKVSNTYVDPDGKPRVVCNQDECKTDNPLTFTKSSAPSGRYSWREILTK